MIKLFYEKNLKGCDAFSVVPFFVPEKTYGVRLALSSVLLKWLVKACRTRVETEHDWFLCISLIAS